MSPHKNCKNMYFRSKLEMWIVSGNNFNGNCLHNRTRELVPINISISIGIRGIWKSRYNAWTSDVFILDWVLENYLEPWNYFYFDLFHRVFKVLALVSILLSLGAIVCISISSEMKILLRRSTLSLIFRFGFRREVRLFFSKNDHSFLLFRFYWSSCKIFSLLRDSQYVHFLFW